MTSTLENFMISHPAVTLSHTDYGLHFHLGNGVNILMTPTQRLQTFVEDDGTPGRSSYRFLVVRRLASFKIVEDSVCASSYCSLDSKLTSRIPEFGHFLLVNLSQIHPSLFFTEIFRRQLATLQKIKKEDEKKNSLQVQVGRHTSFIFLLLTVHAVCALAIFERAPNFQSLQCLEPSPVFSGYRGISSRHH